MNFDATDPKWTAYALDEIQDPRECAALEAILEESHQARDFVEEIRNTAQLLEHELQGESILRLSPGQQAKIESQLSTDSAAASSFLPSRWVAATLAVAASVLIVSLPLTWILNREPTFLEMAKNAGSRVALDAVETAGLSSEADQYEAPSKSDLRDSKKDALGIGDQTGKTTEAENTESFETSNQIRVQANQGQPGRSARNERQIEDKGPDHFSARQTDSMVARGVGEKIPTIGGQLFESTDSETDLQPENSSRAAADSKTVSSPEQRNRTSGLSGQNSELHAGLDPDQEGAANSPSLRTGATARSRQDGNDQMAFAVRPSSESESYRTSGTPAFDDKTGERPVDRPTWQWNREGYDRIEDNPFLAVGENPLSTFSIDVDTASYSNVRRFLNAGSLPPKDAVRIEELINYFNYDYPSPRGDAVFAAHLEMAEAPWKNEHRLLRVGIKGREIVPDRRPASNLVFLIDVSGSMRPPNKLLLVKRSIRLLVEQLSRQDRVAIVVYAGASGLVLPATSGDQKEVIFSALDRLEAGGSTNGGSGIQLAYQTAQSNFSTDGINRVILATDGDFNVGVTNQGDLTRLIQERASSGVFLSVLGFGMGNYQDSTLEKLADQGNGNYAYIDTINEARKVLVEQIQSTLITIAKDVKIQIEFNPAQVAAYRLIGYENRRLRKEDFNDDSRDAGEIGAGHTVTVLYELVPVGQPAPVPTVDPLKYQSTRQAAQRSGSEEVLTLKIRHKEPEAETSQLNEIAFKDSGRTYSQASRDFRFAAAVASFGMLLRDSPYKGQSTLAAALELSQEGLGPDRHGYRREFSELIKKAMQILP